MTDMQKGMAIVAIVLAIAWLSRSGGAEDSYASSSMLLNG